MKKSEIYNLINEEISLILEKPKTCASQKSKTSEAEIGMEEDEEFVLFKEEVNEGNDFNMVSAKFKDALDDASEISTKSVKKLIKKFREKRPDAAMAYAKQAFGWMFKEGKQEDANVENAIIDMVDSMIKAGKNTKEISKHLKSQVPYKVTTNAIRRMMKRPEIKAGEWMNEGFDKLPDVSFKRLARPPKRFTVHQPFTVDGTNYSKGDYALKKKRAGGAIYLNMDKGEMLGIDTDTIARMQKADYGIYEGKVSEAFNPKATQQFWNQKMIKAKTMKDVKKLYPKAKLPSSVHGAVFYIDLEGDKKLYAKAFSANSMRAIEPFTIEAIYSMKGKKQTFLYKEGNQKELSKIETWVRKSGMDYDDWEWDGKVLTIFTKSGTEKYSKKDLKDERVFEGKLTEIKKGDYVGWDDEVGVVNKVKGQAAYVKFKSSPGSFQPIEISALKLKGKYLGKNIYMEGKLTEKLARGLKPLLTIGTKISSKVGEDVLVKLSDKFDRIDDEQADDVASHLNMAIELMQDTSHSEARAWLKKFNNACKDALKGKSIKSAFEGVSESKLTEAREFVIIDPRGNARPVGSKIQASQYLKKMGGAKQGWHMVLAKNALKARRAIEKAGGNASSTKVQNIMFDLLYEGKLNEAEDYKYKKYVKKAFDKILDEMFAFRNAMGVKQSAQADPKIKKILEELHKKLIYLKETMKNKGLTEKKNKGLWANIHAKRKRGERPAKKGEKGYPKTLDIEGKLKEHEVSFSKEEMATLHNYGKLVKKDDEGKDHTYRYVSESKLNEIDMNDPFLVQVRLMKRAAKERKELEAYLKANPQPKKRKISFDKYLSLLDIKSGLQDDMKQTTKELKQANMDMEFEAGDKGEAWNDDDGNRYGGIFMKLEAEYEKLKKKYDSIENKIEDYELS